MSKISHILYGSQTGNAESIAHDLHEKCINLGIPNICCTLNEAKSIDLKNESNFAIIICATTGNGDAPENADSWWRSVKLRSTAKDKFAELPYLTLGLGDTNYDKFCYMGKSIDKRMTELGAVKVHDLYCADEATNLEEIVEEFKIKAISFLLDTRKSNTDSVKITSSTILESESAANSSVADNLIAIVDKNILPVEVLKLKDIAKLYNVDISTAPESIKLSRCTVIDENIDSTKLIYSDTNVNHAVSSGPSDIHEGRWSIENPYQAEVLNAYYLTKNNVFESNVNALEWQEQRRVIHLDLLTDDNIAYEPGDAIGICCPNKSDAIEVVLDRLKKAEPEKNYSMNTLLNSNGNSATLTLGELLTYKIDLTTSLKKSDVMLLSKYCYDDTEKNQLQWLCSKGESGKCLWSSFIESQAIGLAELLLLFPSCTPKLYVLYHYPKFEVLNPMMPRYYSIACSPTVNSRKISIAFSVVQYSCGVSIANDNKINEIKRSGLCTSYLESILKPYLENSDSALPNSLRIRIFLKPTIHFRLPGGISHPLILIGPGTGVAPFIGFLEHRLDAANSRTRTGDDICTGVWRGCFELEAKDLPGEGTLVEQFIHSVAPGPITLFFGCRDENDFLYKNVLHKRLEQGVLSNLEVSMSRISSSKNYVQHRIIEKGEEIASLIINDGAYIFVCGDGNRMAKDVHNALRQVVSKYSGTLNKSSDISSNNISHNHMDEVAAEEYLSDLKVRRRYVLDIWS